MSDLDALLDERMRSIPDWPIEGVVFRDISPVLADPRGLPVIVAAVRSALEAQGIEVDAVAGIEARGFVLGAPLAVDLGVGFVPVRKKGKLPGETIGQNYALEYGVDTIEIHADAISHGDRVLLIDDLIATGGTMMAGRRLLERLGAHVVEGAAIVDLPELGGSKRLKDSGLALFTLVDFAGH